MGVLTAIRRVFSAPTPKRRRDAMGDRASPRIGASYDAAGDPVDMAKHWVVADALDADAANSLAVRKKLRERSRLERANNAYATGMIQTHANVVVGTGPTLRMQTGSPGFNAMVEAAWQRWVKASGFHRKLRTMHLAKTGDGEGFLRAKSNPAVPDEVKLDFAPLECDQVSSGWQPIGAVNRIDGVWFDEFGNAEFYDVLAQHPGTSVYAPQTSKSPTKVDARYMLHWFRSDRPGQHRGVPEITSALMSFAQSRRWREATIAAAETAADFAAVMQMPVGDDGPDVAQPFSTMPIEKRMFVATPAGAEMHQLKAEQPTTQYEMLNRSLLCEQGRPLGMSYVIAALDSSASSFSGGKLDQMNYHVVVAVDRADGESMVLDKAFSLWFEEAASVYGWNVPKTPAPKHAWDWPAKPQIDDAKTANARKTALSCGATSLSRVYAEDGLDFEDSIKELAQDYGIAEDKARAVLLAANLKPAPAASPPQQPDPDEGQANASANHKTNGRRIPEEAFP